MRTLALVCVLAGGCKAVTPPPMMMMNASTRPLPEDTTTAMLVLGGEVEIFGSEGLGLVVRVERQVSDNIAVGAQLGGGRGDEGHKDSRRWLGEVRGYARAASTADTWDWASILGSAGLTVLDTGLVAGTLALQGELSYPNDTFVPALGLTLAHSALLREGDPFGEKPTVPDPTTWYGVSLGGVVPFSDGEGAFVFDLGIAKGDTAGPVFASIGGAWYHTPDE
jgi:hypothetical protein